MKNIFKDKSINIKNVGGLALILVPILLTYVIEIIAYFADFALVFVMNNYLGININYDDSETYSGILPVNTSLMMFLYAMLCLIIFGWWYMLIKGGTLSAEPAIKKSSKKKVAADKNASAARPVIKKMISLAVFGYSFQLLVDGILNLIREFLPALLKTHDETVNSMTDNRSFLMMLTVIVLTPAAEEMIFRGVTLHFSKGITKAFPAVIISAILFGLYHGNPVQMVYAFIAGIILGILVIKTGSIKTAVFLHIIINASAYLIPSFLFDSIPTTVLTVVAAGALIYLMIRIYMGSSKTEHTVSQ